MAEKVEKEKSTLTPRSRQYVRKQVIKYTEPLCGIGLNLKFEEQWHKYA